MTNSIERVSATIYEFPLRGRFAARADVNRFEQFDRFAQAAKVTIVETNGWYHDDAINSDPTRPH